MIREALQFLDQKFVQAKTPTEIKGVNPRGISYLMPDGTVVGTPIYPEPRQHKVGSLGDIILLANRFKEEPAPMHGTPSPVVWYSEQKVVLMLDDGGHRLETATLALPFTDKFKVAMSLRTFSNKPHKDFIRFLRTQFAGVEEAEKLARKVERVRFEDHQVVSGAVLKQRASMGREIDSSVTAAEEIPDVIQIFLPLYNVKDFPSMQQVTFGLDVDAEEKTFRLFPHPDEVERVQQLAMEELEERLEEELRDDIPFYYGHP